MGRWLPPLALMAADRLSKSADAKRLSITSLSEPVLMCRSSCEAAHTHNGGALRARCGRNGLRCPWCSPAWAHLDHILLQLLRVDEVAVVGERDAIGRVYIERLRLGARGGAGGGIAHVADADVAVEVGDGTLGEHVRHHPVVLVQAKVTIRRRRHNASSVLPPVLQRQQRLKEGTGGRAGSCIASYAAHSWRGSVYVTSLPGL